MELIITDRMVERVVYWVIIILLAMLLVLTYLHQPACTTTAVNETDTTVQTPVVVNDTPAPIVSNVTAATCFDGLKNQDETDKDCGGTTCAKCLINKTCSVDLDCASKRCANKKCAAPLSGKISLILKEVDYTGGKTTAAKITNVTIGVINGKEETTDLKLELYTKTSDGTYYLNQLANDELNERYKPYATYDLAPLSSGTTVTETIDLAGKYVGSSFLFSASNRYEAGDDFLIEAVLIDQETGLKIATVERVERIG